VYSDEFVERVEARNSSELVVLDLSQNCITHAGAKILLQALKYNQTVITLDLGNTDPMQRNAIGPRGAKYMKELLIENRFLSFLDISGNILCDQGVYQISLALRVNTTLQKLNLSQNGIT
jgi:Ran GTPase-activating protein (RanGAP) involved in mRNA processing and transport